MQMSQSTNSNNIAEQPKEPRESSFTMMPREKFAFKRTYTFEKRVQWSEEAKEKYGNKLPIVVEKDLRCTGLDDLSNPK